MKVQLSAVSDRILRGGLRGRRGASWRRSGGRGESYCLHPKSRFTHYLSQSSEYESESEEEAPKPLFRPVFVPKYVHLFPITLASY